MKVLFQLTGSIACFKACQALSKLVQAGHEVEVAMSPSALEFVGAATLEGLTGKKVVSDLWEPGRAMDHIRLVRWADLILVCPATANYINRITSGIGDDLLTTMFLAHDFKKPFVVVPAMNTSMYLHPITQASLKRLREIGVTVLEAASGVLACGEVGQGRLLEVEQIVEEVTKLFGSIGESANRPRTVAAASAQIPLVLVTGGGTQEPIDEVRYLGNRSSGRTAASIAEVLTELGFAVDYLKAKSAVSPRGVSQISEFSDFSSLKALVDERLKSNRYMGIIHAAAVSDFSVVNRSSAKIESQQPISLELVPNPKIIASFKKAIPSSILIAFKLFASSATQTEQQQKIRSLFEDTKADWVVSNDARQWDEPVHKYHLQGPGSAAVAVTGSYELGRSLGSILMERSFHGPRT